jgi:dienelactone hydrolase
VSAVQNQQPPVRNRSSWRAAILAAVVLTGTCVAAADDDAGHGAAAIPDATPSDRPGVTTSFVAYMVTVNGRTFPVAGELRVPGSTSATARPAVVIVHGSGGVDSRGQRYGSALNEAGFVTLEIDLWAARGIRSPAQRPKAVSETLPDAFGALALLSARADVDPRRIGIMGFSWGGIVSMLSATQRYRDAFATGDQSFAAHAPLYPVCWVYNVVPGYEFKDLVGAPVFIQAGTADTYDGAARCPRLRDSLPEPSRALVEVRMYDGATHGWDRREPDVTINDPYAHDGRGGPVEMHGDAAVSQASVAATVSYFSRVLGRQ